MNTKIHFNFLSNFPQDLIVPKTNSIPDVCDSVGVDVKGDEMQM